MGSEAGPAVKFHLTGFKKFHNVPLNPTEKLMNRALDYMRKNPLPFGARLESATVLETAGAGALDRLLALLDGAVADEKSAPEPASVVWVHFGVNGGASKIAVEKRAVNEATFRCADEMGWQPQGEPVVAEDGGIGECRESKFAVGEIVERLSRQGFNVVASVDAGRFVCNYDYYWSLRHAALHNSRSLFVHIPLFGIVPEERQLEFIHALLTVLASSIH